MIREENSILFIGPISPPITGPGIKNKIIIDELFRKDQITSIEILNTLKKRIKTLNSILKIFNPKYKIIISVSTYGRYIFVPILHISSFTNKNKKVLLPAGSSFYDELKNMPSPIRSIFIKFLKKFDKILPETYTLKSELESLGLNNIFVIPNPRISPQLIKKETVNKAFSLYYISTIKKSKGIIDCIESIKILKSKGYFVVLNIYGNINNNFKDEFLKKLNSNNDCIYHGILDNKCVIEVLHQNADALLLPTYYQGEGLPGILVESAFAGVPVIISKIKGIEAYFKDGINSLFVEPRNPEDIANKIEILICNNVLKQSLSNNIKKVAAQFDSKLVINKILELLNN